MEDKQVGARVPGKTAQRIEDFAQRRGNISQSEALRRLIDAGLDAEARRFIGFRDMVAYAPAWMLATLVGLLLYAVILFASVFFLGGALLQLMTGASSGVGAAGLAGIGVGMLLGGIIFPVLPTIFSVRVAHQKTEHLKSRDLGLLDENEKR